MTDTRRSGFSLVETLIALALVAGVTAALLPAVALSSRLQQASAVETESAVIAASRLEYLKADIAAGLIGIGGGVDAAIADWHVLVDRQGTPVPAAAASFECRWQIAQAPAPPGVLILTVRIVPLADRSTPLTISVAVPDA